MTTIFTKLNEALNQTGQFSIWRSALSIFKTKLAQFVSRLNMRLMVFAVLVITSSVQAQIKTIQRQQLFTRAYESLSYFINVLQDDEAFIKSLNEKETKMYTAVGELATTFNVLNWLQKNKMYSKVINGHRAFSYIGYPNKEIVFTTPVTQAPQLKFSDDQNLFFLNKDEPARTAMTETEIGKDIYVNINRINDGQATIDFANAVSLLIHEIGHKLGDKKDQDAINSMATKIENNIRSRIAVTTIGSRKINTLIMPGFKFQHWAESFLFGEFIKDGAPRILRPFSVVDEQGTYAWVEDSEKIQDLTEELFKGIKAKSFIRYEALAGYGYAHQASLIASTIKVEPLAKNNFRIVVHGMTGEVIVSMMTAAAGDPALNKVYERSFKSVQPWLNKTTTEGYTFDGGHLKLKSIREATPTSELPQFKIEFFEKRQKGSNLEIFFHIEGQTKEARDHYRLINDKTIWPQVTVMIDQTKTTIPASNYYDDGNEIKFVLKDFDKVDSKQVKIIGLQLRANKENLAILNSNAVGETFLPFEVTLSKGTPAPAIVSKSAPTLCSIQVWDGLNWHSIRQGDSIKKGMHLRFVFKAQEPLRELSLHQGFTVTYNVAATLPPFGKADPLETLKYSTERQLLFTEDQLRQTMRGDFLYVDLNIDQNVKTSIKADSAGHDPEWFRKMTGTTAPKSIPGLTAQMDIETKEDRDLFAVRYVTQSGSSTEVELKNKISFKKPEGQQKPDTQSLKFKPMRCEFLFTGGGK
ncbi:MAG: hypothetical protein H7256_10880 [Bdellovibrio sp.]|nr:hypothetical protein [Bdellovibrio sp.]